MINGQFTWLVTGVAGFIGSNLMEELLRLNQKVVGIDNFSAGYKHNLDEVLSSVSKKQAQNFCFLEGNICSVADCEKVMQGVDYVLHQAALSSVPGSISDPMLAHATNVTGFLNILNAAKKYKVKRVVYASSSAVYGDSQALPKIENQIGKQLSPYAATKYADELYANAFANCYGIETIGLRYFNVFGARQDPDGAYAAVIPLWIKAILAGDPVFINGDGNTTRDFCYIKNVVQANILAALANNPDAINEVYNIAVGECITLNELFAKIKLVLGIEGKCDPCYRDFRIGDVRHSLADVSRAKQKLGYMPKYHVLDGLVEAMEWYKKFFEKL